MSICGVLTGDVGGLEREGGGAGRGDFVERESRMGSG